MKKIGDVSRLNRLDKQSKQVATFFLLIAMLGLNGCAYIYFHLNMLRAGAGSTSFSGLASVKVLTDTSVDLSWPSFPAAKTYTIYNVTSGIPVLIAIVSAPTTTYTVTGLQPYTSYTFRVNVTTTSGTTDANTNDVSNTTLPISESIGAYGVMSKAFVTGHVFTAGASDGAFNLPAGIAFDPVNNVFYLADSNNSRIVKLSGTGAFIGAIGDLSSSSGTCPSSGAASTWCTGGTFTSGSGDGMFYSPTDIAVDPTNDLLYITDYGNNRIVKVKASTGAFIGAIGDLSSSTGTCPSSGAATAWCTGGTFAVGTSDGMFNSPISIRVDAVNDFLYVADLADSRIIKTKASTGAFIGSIGYASSSTGTCPNPGAATGWCTGGTFASGTGDGMLYAPVDLALDTTTDSLYIADSEVNSRIVKIKASTGAFVGAIGDLSSSTGTCPGSGVSNSWCTGGVFTGGAIDGAFNNPDGIAVDPSTDALYVLDSQNDRVVKLQASTGAFVGAVGNITSSTGTCPSSGMASGWCTGGTFSAGQYDGQFGPRTTLNIGGLALDSASDALYVVDSGNSRLVKLQASTGAYLGADGEEAISESVWTPAFTPVSGGGDGMYNLNYGAALDQTNGYLYVADSDRVEKINSKTGAFMGAIGEVTGSIGSCPSSGVASGWCTGGSFTTGTTDGSFSGAMGVAVDPGNDLLYVADTYRIDKFKASTGAFIGSVGRLFGSTGSCPSSGVATSWCTGGSFTFSGIDGGFFDPAGLAVDPTNDALYVTDYFNYRVVKLKASTGAFVGAVGYLSSSSGTCPGSGAAPGWCTGGTFAMDVNETDGTFIDPTSLALDVANDKLYVGDSSKISELRASTGAFLGAIGQLTSSTGTCPSSGAANGWCTGGSFTGSASTDGTFNSLVGMVLDVSTGDLYAMDFPGRISKINAATGAFIGAMGSLSSSSGTCPSSGAAPTWCTGGTFAGGSGDGMFDFIGMTSGMAVDTSSNLLFISDTGNNRVEELSP